MFSQNLDDAQWNVRKVLAPVLVLTCICGLTGPSRKSYRIFGFFYQLFMFGVCILVIILEIPELEFWQNSSDGIHAIIVGLETYCLLTSFILNFVLTAFKSYKANDLIDLLNRKLTLPQTVLANIFKFNLVHTLLNIFPLILYNVLGTQFLWQNEIENSYSPVIYIFMDLIIQLFAFEFIQIINILREMFKTINSKLKDFKDHGKAVTDIEVHLDEKEIVRLRKLHLFLTKTCAEVNSCFTVQIFLVILFSMIEILYALRLIIKDFTIQELDVMILMIFCHITWMLPFSSLVLQLIIFSEKTCSEVRKSLSFVHHLMNLFYYDKKAVKELIVFAMQIHQNPVGFAVGFFDLNYPFLNTVISTQMAYLIIIVTFQGESDNGVLSNWGFSSENNTAK